MVRGRRNQENTTPQKNNNNSMEKEGNEYKVDDSSNIVLEFLA
jgi:hypothetical protein